MRTNAAERFARIKDAIRRVYESPVSAMNLCRLLPVDRQTGNNHTGRILPISLLLKNRSEHNSLLKRTQGRIERVYVRVNRTAMYGFPVSFKRLLPENSPSTGVTAISHGSISSARYFPCAGRGKS